ncbi:MAG TPA: adenylate/guanylate cyclase domain-containing protein, partial [Acidimicrobiia bacterium]|nr:adenylate/guanylate cyclase domain-containing protein [Acidimicrobiia bacterium]
MTTTGVIVFTDIVGFTQLTDEHGDDLALALLERQEKVVRSGLPECGRVVKELGDGLLLWFDDARSAIETCLALQRAFDDDSDTGVPLWVRMGAHFGTPRARGDDIVGRDVN